MYGRSRFVQNLNVSTNPRWRNAYHHSRGNHAAPAVSDEPETAFEQLSATQKRAVLAERPSLSGKEIAVEVGVSEATIVNWKQLPVFQEAIREMLIPAFRTESLLMVMADLRRVIQSGKARPEDRKLLAELSGLTQGDAVNVNIAVDNTGWFSKRWKQH